MIKIIPSFTPETYCIIKSPFPLSFSFNPAVSETLIRNHYDRCLFKFKVIIHHGALLVPRETAPCYFEAISLVVCSRSQIK